MWQLEDQSYDYLMGSSHEIPTFQCECMSANKKKNTAKNKGWAGTKRRCMPWEPVCLTIRLTSFYRETESENACVQEAPSARPSSRRSGPVCVFVCECACAFIKCDHVSSDWGLGLVHVPPTDRSSSSWDDASVFGGAATTTKTNKKSLDQIKTKDLQQIQLSCFLGTFLFVCFLNQQICKI